MAEYRKFLLVHKFVKKKKKKKKIMSTKHLQKKVICRPSDS